MSKPALKIEDEYRSRLETKVAKQLTEAGIPFGYETLKVHFKVPARPAKYTPDFVTGALGHDFSKFKPSLIVLETKGYFRTTADRQRLIQMKECNPTLDLRLVFQDANKPIYKGSPTSYGKWAEDHDFPWADKGTVPAKWIEEMRAQQ